MEKKLRSVGKKVPRWVIEGQIPLSKVLSKFKRC
jgi:hypothetical protein